MTVTLNGKVVNSAGQGVPGKIVKIEVVPDEVQPYSLEGQYGITGATAVTSDASGAWTITIPGSANLTPPDKVKYKITEGKRSYYLDVPTTGGPYSVADLFNRTTPTDPGVPTPDFTWQLGQGAGEVQFTDTSVGTVDKWEWDFTGDGIIESGAQNPTFTFPGIGTYTARLTVSNSKYSVTVSKTVIVTAPPVVVKAQFDWHLDAVWPFVQFRDLSQGAITSWAWDFTNNGSTDSTLKAPKANYGAAGTYTAKLTVSDGVTSDSITHTVTVPTNPTPPSNPRGKLFMGMTFPYGGVTSTYLSFLQRAEVQFARCGWPEIENMLSSPSNPSNAGTFNTNVTGFSLEAQLTLLHNAGLGFIFSGLGVPTQVNSSAGSGEWKYFPTTSGGRTQMGNYMKAVCDVLNPLFDYIEWYQESNIPGQNPGLAALGMSAATAAPIVAAAMKSFIDTVRAYAPSQQIVAGSIANRGNWKAPVANDIGWTGPAWLQLLLNAEPTLKTTSAPHFWGYHDYVGLTDPADSTVPWAMGQLDEFHNTLVRNGCQAPGGGSAKVMITEYGVRRADMTDAESVTFMQHYYEAHQARRDAGWLAGAECIMEELGTSKSLYMPTAPYDPYNMGIRFETISKTVLL